MIQDIIAFIYTKVKGYNVLFEETTTSCELSYYTIIDIAFKSNEINKILDKYKYASKSYKDKINDLIDSYNLTLTMAEKGKRFFMQGDDGNKLNIYAKGKNIYEDVSLVLTKYYCYYDYICIRHWFKKRMEEVE